MTIKGNLGKLIEFGDLKPVLKVLRNIIINKDFADNILKLYSRYEKNNQRLYVQGITSFENFNQEENIVRDVLVQEVHALPDDFDLLKYKIRYLIINKGEILNAINLLMSVLKDFNNIKIVEIKNNIDNFSNQNINNNTLENGDLIFWEQSVRKAGKDIIEEIEHLSNHSLSVEWTEIFWTYLNNEKYFFYEESQNLLKGSGKSLYYDDIIRISSSKEIKNKLLLWEEEYLSNSYEEAIKFCNDIRYELDHQSSQVYEYLMLAFFKENKPDKIIAKALSNEEDPIFKKLLIFVERAYTFPTERMPTLEHSLKEIFNGLLESIKRIYNNIAFDYSLDKYDRKLSKKKELVTRCIDLSLFLWEYFKIEEYNVFYEIALLELEGGGKYTWLKPTDDSKIKNLGNYDAIKKYEQLKNIISTKNPNNLCLEELYNSLNLKAKKLLSFNYTQVQKKRLLSSCVLGYTIYQDDKFIQLASKIENDAYYFLEQENLNQPFSPENDLEELERIYQGLLKKITPSPKQSISQPHIDPNSKIKNINNEPEQQIAESNLIISTNNKSIFYPFHAIIKDIKESKILSRTFFFTFFFTFISFNIYFAIYLYLGIISLLIILFILNLYIIYNLKKEAVQIKENKSSKLLENDNTVKIDDSLKLEELQLSFRDKNGDVIKDNFQP